VRGFEHREPVADVGRAPEPQPADHLRAEVRHDVAVQVGRHQHVVVEGVLQQPHRDGVHVGIVHRDVGELVRDVPRGLEEQPVGGTDHVGLVDDRDLPPPEAARELEGGAYDALGPLLRVHLARHGVGVEGNVAERPERPGHVEQHVTQPRRHRRELDAGVQVLRVLAEDDEVDPSLKFSGLLG
jgi:hypothetical protein